MKIFIVTNCDTTNDIANQVYAFTRDQNNTLTVFALIRNVDAVEMPDYEQRINDVDRGYNEAVKLLTGEFTYDWVNKPRINDHLLVKMPELFGTEDVYSPSRVAFLNRKLFGSGELAGHEIYAFNRLNGRFKEFNATALIGSLEAYNLYAESFGTKRHPRNIKTLRYQALVGFPYPSSDVDSDETFLAIFPDNNTKLIFNNIDVEPETLTYDQFFNDYLVNKFITCKLEKLAVNEDKSITVKVTTLTDGKNVPNIPVILSTDSGYINRTKVITDDKGEAVVKFIPLGLDVGDKVVLSAGFKLFTGVYDLQLTVE